MPLTSDMKLNSEDDHVIEHPTVWSDRLPAALRHRGPRIIEVPSGGADATGKEIPEGSQVWTYDGNLHHRGMLDATAGIEKTSFNRDPYRYDQIRSACYEPQARLRDMDEDGVFGAACFPTFPKFAGTTFLQAQDKDLALLCVRAYNDFIIDEWCATDPDRLIPIVILPLWDPQASAAEIERCAAKGARAITFPENPVPLGLPSFHTDHWDPVFAAAQAADLPLCMHFGTSGQIPTTSPDAPFPVSFVIIGCNSMATMTDLLYSPVFHKFDRLKIALSEGGIGWMPYIVERADYVWDRHGAYGGLDLSKRPSQLFREHFWGCFLHDEAGIRERQTIGIDRIMWEADYPHSDSVWPLARKRAEELLADVPDDEVRRIVELNARDLFHLAARA
jgi:predicted TIM-barrel fold metal-dependent hydrolase